MTNAEIIMNNMFALVEAGVITEEQEINTFIGWKMKGYRIKKGAEHIAEFPIWVKTKVTKKQEEKDAETEEETTEKKRKPFVLKTAYWFTDQQVEKI